MNASKFVSDTSHQHNTSLHSYLYHPSSSSITINASSQQQRTVQESKPIHGINNTVSSKHIDEEVQSSLPDQIRQEVTGNIDKKHTQFLHKSIIKVANSGSKKNLKRNSADIQSYFINSGKVEYVCHSFSLYFDTYVHPCMYISVLFY